MRIHVLSDLHLKGKSLETYLPARTDADVVVLAGDITDSPSLTMAWARRHFEQTIVVVAGNHEFFGSGIQSAISEARAASDDRVRFLENEAALIGGVRFLGATLWTDFKLDGQDTVRAAMSAARDGMIDFQSIYLDDPRDGMMAQRFTPSASAKLHATSREFLRSAMAEPFDGPTVVVTHHAPHPGSIAAMWDGHPVTPCFVSDLHDVILGGAPELWIHGHTHTSFDYDVGGTRILCNPEMGNSWFHPALVVDVQCRPPHLITLEDLVAGRIAWPEAASRLGIVDPWPIRAALLGIRPWSLIAKRFSVPVEAISAIHAFIRPRPQIWPETISLAFSSRMRAALTVLDGLPEIPAEFCGDETERGFDR